jgi:hypothetical protein
VKIQIRWKCTFKVREAVPKFSRHGFSWPALLRSGHVKDRFALENHEPLPFLFLPDRVRHRYAQTKCGRVRLGGGGVGVSFGATGIDEISHRQERVSAILGGQ